MMYAIIFANLLGFTTGPAFQGIVSKSVDADKQGITMGSLTAINSMMGVVGPLAGTPLLALVGHLPPRDWRVGITFFLCALLQTIALVQALRYFQKSS
jgi:DHA1 family tetracycline resistance protein-like MFS transporter